MSERPRRRAGSIPRPDVVLFTAQGCHLCDSARRVLEKLRAQLGFDLREIDITGDPELEARYRELIPVVEIDGERAFTYYVQPEPFRRRLRDAQSRRTGGSL